MSQKIAVITGPTAGIGKVTTLALAQKGFKMVLLARNPEKARALQQQIGQEIPADFIRTDLADLDSVRSAVQTIRQRYQKIDVLINNAGVIADQKAFSPNQIELTFASNHLGHFLLTTELLGLLKAAGDARIVHVSSGAHRFARFRIDDLVNPARYFHFTVYGNSKLANILFSNELAERYNTITSNALHPGTVASSFGWASTGVIKWFVQLGKPFFKTAEQGARTSIYLAASPDVKGVTGGYFENARPGKRSAAAKDKGLAVALWELSEALVQSYRS